MSNAQTEARASLWVPAKPEHAKLGWTYDFEQTERISRAAYDSTGYEATMEVVEFVMAEADRRHATALEAQAAELAAVNHAWRAMKNRAHAAEAALAEARKALEALGTPPSPIQRLGAAVSRRDWHEAEQAHEIIRDIIDAARCVREQGGENG